MTKILCDWKTLWKRFFMHKTFLSLGALLGGIAVALGAFGAHGLKRIVSPEVVSVFQTGVQYQMYHTLALLVLPLYMIAYQQMDKMVRISFFMRNTFFFRIALPDHSFKG